MSFLNRILYCFLFQKLNSSPSPCFRLYFKHQFSVYKTQFTRKSSRHLHAVYKYCRTNENKGIPLQRLVRVHQVSIYSYVLYYCKGPLSIAAKQLYHHDDGDGDDGVIRSFTRFDVTVVSRFTV